MASAPLDIPRQAGQYVRTAREAAGLTRAQLAEKCGVSERLLASLELGDATGIRLDKLLAVLHAVGLSLSVSGEALSTSNKRASGAGSSHASGESASLQTGSDRKVLLAAKRRRARAAGTQTSYEDIMLSTSGYERELAEFLAEGSSAWADKL